MPRQAFISLLRDHGVQCRELNIEGYRGTLWEINDKQCFITYEQYDTWFQVPQKIFEDAIDVIIFFTKEAEGRPKPFLIATEDFYNGVANLDEPSDGSYNINKVSGDWPHIEMTISAGNNTSVSAPLAGDMSDLKMTLIFDTLELLENENDDPRITEAFRQVEKLIGR